MSHLNIMQWVIARAQKIVLGLLAVGQSEKVRLSVEATVWDWLVAFLASRFMMDC